ncbi:MA3 and MIF4G domain containing protein [Trichuris trichiura]|uniref:MA3 and MIF4G domain containing protein n=1 Tax=Trichuris trichiura TaxID=36087 RepID=A0A077Z216_TRITR|nr:MA3 and MIF4G domain containing protein [Trichuris trichiura]
MFCYSQEYQRIAWDQLKKHIHGLVNRVNASNIIQVIEDLFKVNLIRGRGIFVRAIMQAQSFAQPYSFIMAALAAVVNSKFPAVGELLLHRLLSQFKRAFKRNDRDVAVPSIKFIAHLINQQVAHEVLALELLTLLLEIPTDDSVELSVAFLRECGAKMSNLSPVGMNAIFDRLRSILHEAEVDPRVQFMIEVLFQIRKDKFVNNPPIAEGLDLVEEEDQITHAVSLDSELNLQEELNLFRYDPEFEKNEQAYEDIRNEILESESETEELEEKSDEETDKQTEQATAGQNAITDLTEINLITFRRTVYLTIQSSLDFQEAIHKLLKMDIKPGYEAELCNMILDCCAQQRTYEKFFGLMAERFCRLKQEYQHHFESLFKDVYLAVHRFEITKLRNSARLFAHLFFTDSISWMVPLHCIRLTEADTTSPSRIFIKILFHELVEFMGLQSLFDRIEDATMQAAFDGLFPRDHPHNTRFAINFYTSIGLGGLTIGMREHLKSVPKERVVKLPAANEHVEAEHSE